jgi:hypothetical protein
VRSQYRAARASAAHGRGEAGAEGPQRLEQAHYVEIKRQAWRVVAKTVAGGAGLTILFFLIYVGILQS